ncbi:hypothetical protein [Desulfogranum marinum]|uniref:hypothetical protein n=1 Tax=Desulfogranum marinum TaxID=453220 RepID=UPI0029C66B05|nr:hypothetical protein [Desulfogranum marinum]
MSRESIDKKNTFKIGAIVAKRKRPSANVKKRFDRDLVKSQQNFFEDPVAHTAFMKNVMEIKAA